MTKKLKSKIKFSRRKYSEKEMVMSYCKFLEKQNHEFTVEVPFFNRSVDLVYKNNETNETYSIEFKLRDWRKAILQAEDLLIGCQNVYICLPQNRSINKVKSIIRDRGFGLIIYDEKNNIFQTVVSCENENTWKTAESILDNGFEYSINNRNYELLQSIT